MRIALVLVACAACGSSGDDALVDGSVDAAPPPGFPARLTIGASTGSLRLPFEATIAGSGTGASPLGTVDITRNVGTLAIAGVPGRTALYNTTPFGAYTLFGSFVIAPDHWTIAYPYCMNGALTDVYAETVGPGGFVLLEAIGTCAATATSSPTTIDLPAFTIPTPSAFGSATVHGAAIDLDHGAGRIAIGSSSYPAVVFDTVDCSACDSPGWYELHTLIWDEANASATFVIVYLRIGMPDRVQLSYALRLPQLDDPFHDALLPATWTGTAARAVTVPPHLPPPWLTATARTW